MRVVEREGEEMEGGGCCTGNYNCFIGLSCLGYGDLIPYDGSMISNENI